MKRFFALLSLLVVLPACSGTQGDSCPAETWATSTPEEQGVDSTVLVEMLRDIVGGDLPVHSVVVVRHGRLVLEAYFDPYRKQDRHIIFSATKSITAMLTGVAVTDGLITDAMQPVLGLLPEHRDRLGHLDDYKRDLDLRHLLTMTAGFNWQDGPYGVREEGDFSRMLAASDGIAYILDKAVVATPGSRYNYNSGCSHLLGGRTVRSAEGLGGNGIYVVPGLDLVVVFTGGMVGLEMLAPYRYLEEYILPAVRSSDPLPANPELEGSLERLTGRASASSHGPAPTPPSIAAAVSGRRFEIEDRDNLLGIEELCLDFPTPETGRLLLAYSGTGRDADWGMDAFYRTDDMIETPRTVAFDFGLDGRSRRTLIEHDEIGNIPLSAQGRWETEGRLVLTVVTAWAIPQEWTIEFGEGDTVSLTIDSTFYGTSITGRPTETAGPTPLR